MAISSTTVITSEVNNYTLSELLDTLGSPKRIKAALEELEVASKKAAAAQRDLDKSERTRIDAVEAAAEARAKEIVAISNDKTALAAAWAKLDEDTAAHNSQTAKWPTLVEPRTQTSRQRSRPRKTRRGGTAWPMRRWPT